MWTKPPEGTSHNTSCKVTGIEDINGTIPMAPEELRRKIACKEDTIVHNLFHRKIADQGQDQEQEPTLKDPVDHIDSHNHKGPVH